MRSKILSYSLLLSCLSIFSFSCTKDSTPADPASGLLKLGEGYAVGSGARVELYSDGPLYTGYNFLYVALFDSVSGQRLTDAHVHLHPMMDMGTMMHGSPYENPSGSNAVNGLFPCSATFVMPSTAGSWSLEIHVHNHANFLEGEVEIPLTVTEPAEPRLQSFISKTDGASYFLSLVSPRHPKVGINDFELAVYKKQSMMDWPADSSLSFQITPEMPSMGHGSPNNVDPVHMHNGHFMGKVNFTMTGLWRIHLDSYSGGEVADTSAHFDIDF